MKQNYILPFLWMKGESREVIAEEIDKIAECGIGAVCVESRPHPDFGGPTWWEDMAFIIRECKKKRHEGLDSGRCPFPHRLCQRTDQEQIPGAEKALPSV